MSRGIYWFRNDLRIEDNEGLVKASESNEEVLPVYVLDNRWLEGKQKGIDRIGPFRLQFLLESLIDLKQQLQSIGSDLFFAIGNPSEVLSEIYRSFGCQKIYAQAASAHEEQSEEESLHQEFSCEFFWTETLYHIADLPFTPDELPSVFTQFRKAVEKQASIRQESDAPLYLKSPKGFGSRIPEIEELGFERFQTDPRAVIQFKGGTAVGKNRLQYYLWDKELLSTYKQTRNGLIGGDYSSKFSPWLSLGCLSPKHIYWQIKKFEKYIKKNSSTYWLVFELLWRDYFHFLAHRNKEKLFLLRGITNKETSRKGTEADFKIWSSAQTGNPFVDANMSELNATGFMSNRGRQNVASYLVHDMQVDWRLGAAYFEKMLIDYDPCSNYGNWQYIAGVGNDPRGGRHFDIDHQKATYDPQGDYQAIWSV